MPESERLFALSALAQAPSAEGALQAVREFLGMDVAYLTEFVDGKQVFRLLEGDVASFGLDGLVEIPLEETYCQQVLAGRLPNLIPDVRGDERAAALAVTEAADVGAFASVPLRFSDGRLFGTLCAASHQARSSFGYRDLQFLQVFARMVADLLEREQLHESRRDLELQATAANAILAAVQARDAYTGEHSHAVVAYAVAVATQLELDEATVDDVRHVALLHDIGKLAIPDAILNKAGPLNDVEWTLMRTHPAESERIVRALPGLQHLAAAVRAEHERWDGSGYPDGLAGEQIPLASRITLVCDAYHAMVSDRPYRSSLPAEAARQALADGSGTQFCPAVTRALLECLGAPPTQASPQSMAGDVRDEESPIVHRRVGVKGRS